MKSKRFPVLIVFIIIAVGLLSAVVSYAGSSEDNSLRAEFDDYLQKSIDSGALDDIIDYWYDNYENGKLINLSSLTGENGTLNLGVKQNKPFTYIQNNHWAGIEIEIAYNFCMEKGYKLEIKDYKDINSVVLSTSEGKVDFGGSTISITEERKKSIDYSIPYFENHFVVLINKSRAEEFHDINDLNGHSIGTTTGNALPAYLYEDFTDFDNPQFNTLFDLCFALENNKIDFIMEDESAVSLLYEEYPSITPLCYYRDVDYFAFVFPKEKEVNGGIIESVKDSFRKTFILEDRYRIILQGIGNTLLITVASVLLGLIGGFLVFMLCRKGNRLVNGITRFCCYIVDGLPAIVLLMILYYIVFGNISIGSVTVSIAGFTLIFASSTFASLKNSVDAIGKGQYEVSYALGYSENHAFFKMILPQALKFFWTPLKSSIVTQIKTTSVVGYIAAQDLTKSVDMIRSSTFEALFPLLSAAVLYFIMAWLLIKLVNAFQINATPSSKKSSKYLKGVNLHD